MKKGGILRKIFGIALVILLTGAMLVGQAGIGVAGLCFGIYY